LPHDLLGLLPSTEVASDKVDAETYAAFNRAVREAVKRINANKAAYMQYFIGYHAQKAPAIGSALFSHGLDGMLRR
jgi:hypothetical protein